MYDNSGKESGKKIYKTGLTNWGDTNLFKF